LLVFLALSAFAGNSLLARAALSGGQIDPAIYTAVRLISGAVTLGLLCLYQRRSLRPSLRKLPGAATLFLYAAAFSFAYLRLPAGTGALLLFSSVQLTMTAASYWQGHRVRGLELVGQIMALAGLAWLVSPGLAAPPLLAALMMALAGIAWGLYTVIGRGATDPISETARNLVGAAILSLIPLLFASMTARVAGIALAMVSGIVCTALGYVIWYRTLPHLPIMAAGVAQLAVPVITSVGGTLWLFEDFTVRLVGASLVILSGIGLSLWIRFQRPDIAATGN
jgi:drug/metabolite transporter (DMT)-like permease